MALPDPAQSPEPPPEPRSDGEVRWFEPGERVRWLTYIGTVVHHRGVPYVLFDHHLAPPGAAYAVTKLERIAPVQAVGAIGGPAGPPLVE